MKDWLEQTAQGVIIRLRIQPRASKTEWVGLYGDPPRIKLRLAAPPVDGRANEELLQFLKECLNVSSNQLQMIRGQSSPQKDVLCRGLSMDEIKRKLSLNP